MKKYVLAGVVCTALLCTLTGCLAAAAGAGAEAGYVATQDTRTTGETLSDQVIVTKIKSKFIADSEVSAWDISVVSYKGVVTLKGFVKSTVVADRAVTLAREVQGVKEVLSKLVLG